MWTNTKVAVTSILAAAGLAAGLLGVGSAAYADATVSGAPHVFPHLFARGTYFWQGSCGDVQYQTLALNGPPDSTPYTGHMTLAIADAAGEQVASSAYTGTSVADLTTSATYQACAGAVTAGTWTATETYWECTGENSNCAVEDALDSVVDAVTFVVTELSPVVTELDEPSTDLSGSSARVSAHLSTGSAVVPRAVITVPTAGAQVTLQKKRPGHTWKNVRTLTASATGLVHARIKRTGKAFKVRFYLPATVQMQKATSRAVKVKARAKHHHHEARSY